MDCFTAQIAPYLAKVACTVHDYPLVEIKAQESVYISEQALLEFSLNSVRLSVQIAERSAFSECILQQICNHFSGRSDLLRNEPLSGFDLTFLITAQHVQYYSPEGASRAVWELIQHVKRSVGVIQAYLEQTVIRRAWELL